MWLTDCNGEEFVASQRAGLFRQAGDVNWRATEPLRATITQFFAVSVARYLIERRRDAFAVAKLILNYLCRLRFPPVPVNTPHRQSWTTIAQDRKKFFIAPTVMT